MSYVEVLLTARPEFLRCSGREAGDTFILRAGCCSDVTLPSPILLELGRGRYAGSLLASEPGNYTVEVVWVGSAFESWSDAEPSSHPRAVSNGASVARHFTINELTEVEGFGDGLPAAKGPQPCDAAASTRMAGRWLGEDWAPLSCYLLPYTSALLRRCTATRPLRLRLFGDSAMRSVYRAMAATLVLADQTPGDGMLPSMPNQTEDSEASLTLEGGRVQLSWASWTLGESESSGAMALAPILSNQADQVVILGDSRNVTNGGLLEYDAHLGELASRVRSSMQVPFRRFWIAGPAGLDTECYHCHWHRQQLFSSTATRTLSSKFDVIDSWRLGAAPTAVGQRNDSLSATVANMLLNAVCNPRLVEDLV